MRLFTAIELSADVRTSLARLIEKLRPEAALNWSRVDNLHVTTKFIGEWPEARLEEIEQTLTAIRPAGAIPIAVRGLGWFPNPRAPRVFWAGVEAPAELAWLARDTEKTLSAIGVPAEDRPFRPHLTLARIRDSRHAGPVRQAMMGLGSLEFGSFAADRFYLYCSERRPSGSVYVKLAEYNLNQEQA